VTDEVPLYVDATMLYRWRHLAPVGIVRLERMVSAHLRSRSSLGRAELVVWDGGYRPVTPDEESVIDDLLLGTRRESPHVPTAELAPDPPARRGMRARTRRVIMKGVERLPEPLRPLAHQTVWYSASFAIESTRYARQRLRERRGPSPGSSEAHDGVRHRIDFSRGGDLVAIGLGWEYLDHEAMYLLKQRHGLRIHMPAFDLIPVQMPHLNIRQSHLVHRYYADMAHYASSITCISEATASALRQFYDTESLPHPHIVTNPLPGFGTHRPLVAGTRRSRGHRFEGQPYVLSVSTIEIRKNHLLLAKLWAELVREGVDIPRLVIIGRLGWDVNEFQQWVAHAPELADHCTVAHDVHDDELVGIYEDALFTVFPSRVEGWGLPITESLTYGKVCVHSTDPAQLEASQGLMPALHPDDFLGWKAEILRLVGDDEYRTTLERAIRDRYVPRTETEYCLAFERIIADRREG
jgi:glycosyltransferase involved in cell wall biosynthesis